MSENHKTNSNISNNKNTDSELKLRKSRVRVIVTYSATGFVFLGATILIIWFLSCGKFTEAKDLFLAVLPVATGIITYWFADRSRAKKPNSE